MKKINELIRLLFCCLIVSCSEKGDPTSEVRFELSGCASYKTDDDCLGTRESCLNPMTLEGYGYSDAVSDYLGFLAHSNGACTGCTQGVHQCAQFAKDFFVNRLHHKDNAGFTEAWTATTKNGYINVALSAEESHVNPLDPLFVFRSANHGWNGLTESPRETDVLVFENGGAGHFVVTMSPKDKTESSFNLPIIEENVAAVADYGPGGSCHHRVLKVTKDDAGMWDVESGIGYDYTGFIRHNLAGIYSDVGWHDDGTSQAFRDAYLNVAYGPNGPTGKSLGWAFSDHEGSPFVHTVHGVQLQNFINTNPENHFATDGQTALALGKGNRVFLLKEGFWGAYKCIPGSDGSAMGGAEWLGSPMNNETKGRIDGDCRSTINSAIPEVMYQHFEKGCLWWRPDEVDAKIHIHLYSGSLIDTAKATACGVQVENNPPSADCIDECTPGTQQCAGSTQIQICGHPGQDSCYHWLTLKCGEGTSCINHECTSSSSVSIASISSGGASASTGGKSSTGGSTSSGIQHCVHSARQCASDPNNYQICILDSYTGSTDWMDFACPSGQRCETRTGNCVIYSQATSGGTSATGGASSSNPSTVSIALASSSGGSSVGGSSSLSGSSFISMSGTGGVSSTSTSPSNSNSTGGAGFVNSISSGGSTASISLIPLHLHYEGPTKGAYWIGGWWKALDERTDILWETSLLDCVDQNISDQLFDCDLMMIPSGVQNFTFQIYLPDGRFWGDESSDPTGGNGSTIGIVTLSKGSLILNYSMIPNQFGDPYYNGLLNVVP